MRLSFLCAIIAVAALVLSISQLILEVYLENDSWPVLISQTQPDYSQSFQEVTIPVVVWWAPIGGVPLPAAVRECGKLSCYFTRDRQFRFHPQIKAFMFYGSTTNFTDLPLPRNSSNLLWALLHEESPRNNPPLSHSDVISLFNFTSTFSRHSNFPLTTQYLKSIHSLTDKTYFVSTSEKNRFQKEEGLAPVAFLQTDCSTMNDRDSYVSELAKHIPVDSYGACLHNKDLPLHLQAPYNLETMMADDLFHLLAKYKFMLAIENGVCQDYITEKLWRPLICGTVPIYIGSPTVADWLPNNKSALLGLHFESAKTLAEHLHKLNTNDDDYNSHLDHKLKSEVTNAKLNQSVETRTWDTEWPFKRGDFVQNFECFVCKQAHNQGVGVAAQDDYFCPMPKSILSQAPNASNFWLHQWFYGRCEAKVIRQFVDLGVRNFTHQEYENALKQLLMEDKCYYSEQNAKEFDLL